MTDAALQRARGRWSRGVSGNPAGRPRGSPNRSHVYLRELIEGGAEDVVKAVITAAKAGDMVAARLVLDRVLPRRVCRPLGDLALPPIRSVADARAALEAITSAAIKGTISPAEAQELASVVEIYRRTIETADFEARLSMVEDLLKAKR